MLQGGTTFVHIYKIENTVILEIAYRFSYYKIFCSTSLHPPLKANRGSPLFVSQRSALDRACQRPSHSIVPFFSISVYQEIIIEKSQTSVLKMCFSIIIS